MVMFEKQLYFQNLTLPLSVEICKRSAVCMKKKKFFQLTKGVNLWY